MTTYTPGPWNVTGLYVRERNGGLIASILDLWHGQRTPKAKKNANARLISAAPELLEALENIVAAMETDEEAAPTASWMDNLYASVDAARAIIAKATSPKGK